MSQASKATAIKRIVHRKQKRRPKVVKEKIRDIRKRFGLGGWQRQIDKPD